MFTKIKGLVRLTGYSFPIYYVQGESVSWGGRTLKRNALIVWYKKDMVYCDHFPKGYKGTNPMLKVNYYDFDFQVWNDAYVERSAYTKVLYAVWKREGQKKIRPSLDEHDYVELMKHDHVCKNGTGQKDRVHTISDDEYLFRPSGRGAGTGRYGRPEGMWATMGV